MSKAITREEAVREAIEDAFLDRSYDVWPDMVRESEAAVLALDAHDAAHGIHRLVIDDETVERAARKLMAHRECEPFVPWLGASAAICEVHETDWVAANQCCANALDDARLVLAAAVEAGQ